MSDYGGSITSTEDTFLTNYGLLGGVGFAFSGTLSFINAYFEGNFAYEGGIAMYYFNSGGNIKLTMLN